MSPSHCPALHCQKLTHKPHGDVTQNEEEEEDTADDICAAPWREMGETFGEGMLGTGGVAWSGGVVLWRVGGCWKVGVGSFHFILFKKTFFWVGKLSSEV